MSFSSKFGPESNHLFKHTIQYDIIMCSVQIAAENVQLAIKAINTIIDANDHNHTIECLPNLRPYY